MAYVGTPAVAQAQPQQIPATENPTELGSRAASAHSLSTVSISDPRPAFLNAIDLGATRIVLSNKPIVLLCGGSVHQKDRPDDPTLPIQSMRDAISREFPEYEIFRPEEIDTWHSDGVFKNLVDFENDLASICSLVVVILESAGSLAELGAFSQNETLRDKIVAIRSTEFSEDISFINLGLLRFIANSSDTAVKSFPWDVNNPTSIEDEVVKDVVEGINTELARAKKSKLIDVNHSTHIVVMICELIKLFRVLKEVEILKYLLEIGTDINSEQLKRKLFLMVRFGLLKIVEYESKFYIRTDEVFHTISFQYKVKTHIDALRLTVDCNNYYSSDKGHKNHMRAIKRYLAKGQP